MALTQDVTMTRVKGAFRANLAAGAKRDTPGGLVVQEMVDINFLSRSVKTHRFPWMTLSKYKRLSSLWPRFAISSSCVANLAAYWNVFRQL